MAVTAGEDGDAILFTVTDAKTTVVVSGTKTWLDGSETHGYADEITLVLKRSVTGGNEETVNANPTWNGSTYTFADLDEYDDLSQLYTYTVTEIDKAGFNTSYDRKGYTQDITNLRVGEVKVSGRKTWLPETGANHPDYTAVQLTLKRISAKPGSTEELCINN